MTFLWPWAFAALVIVPVVVAGYVWSRRRRRLRAGALAARGLAVTAGAKRPAALEHLPFALFTLALAVLVVACARPMTSVPVPTESATMILDLDVSNSMGAADATPSRIVVAKSAARALVGDEPPSVRIGVVGFGQDAVIVARPSTDHAAALRAIDSLSLGGGTSLASGILAALDAVAGKTLRVNLGALGVDNSADVDIGYYANATIVLLSDGEDTSSTGPVTMARLASTAGVRIETLGVGSAAGTTLKIGKFEVATAEDPTTLTDLARLTNGSYHHLVGPGDQAALTAVSKAVVLHTTFATRHTEVTALFAVAGAILLAAGATLSTLWYGRVV